MFLHYLLILLSISFLTLHERHLLGLSQLRLGPNKPAFLGSVTPFFDALKLFQKSVLSPHFSMGFYYYFSPFFMFFLMFFYWILGVYYYPLLSMSNASLFFLCLLGSTVYSVFLLGYAAKSKYTYLGAMRATAQSVTFEVGFFFLVLSYMSLFKDYGFTCSLSGLFLPLSYLWLIFMLVELGRAPVDFPECESELVSGYNLEYSGGLFVLIFLGEYGFILFFCSFFCQIFMGWLGAPCLSFYLLLSFCIFLRSCLPRYRYDLLMSFFWKTLVPFSMVLFLLYFSLLSF